MSKYAIDFGHGVGQDRGAGGYIPEETIIDMVGELVVSKLVAIGNEVIQTRPSYASSVSNSLYQRYIEANNNNCDYCISIHANASDGNGHGTEVFTYNAKEVPQARNVLNNIVNMGFTDRGIKDGSHLAMVARPSMTAMLIEICFCDNESDTNQYNSLGAEAIANAIVKGLTGQSVVNLGWNLYPKGWWYCTDVANEYYYKDQWKFIDGEYYLFDIDGYAKQSSWVQDGGRWYWLKSSCKMAKNEWIWINGECYYFFSDGVMASNMVTPDGFKVDESGAWTK